MAGFVISVIGGKGGVGKSVFASSLALAFMKEFSLKPLLVDQDFTACGDQNVILGMKPAKGLLEAVQHTGAFDQAAMVRLAAAHASGLHYLSAPPTIPLSRGITPDMLGKLYKAMPNVYPLTVIDCGSQVDPWTIKAMEFSTLIFLVTNPDILVMHQTKRIMTEMVEQLFPLEMIEVVLNRFVQNAAVAPATIQRTLGKPVYAAIPEDAASMGSALTQGKPLVLAAPSAPSTRAIHEMVRKMQQNQLLQKLSQLKKPSRAQVAASQKQVGGVALAPGSGKPVAAKEPDAPRIPGQLAVVVDPWNSLKLRVHKELVEKIDFKKESNNQAGLRALREKCRTAVVDILNQEDTASVAPTRDDLQQLVKEILDEALGFGPLEDLLADDAVTEIMVNSATQIYMEKGGKPTLSKVLFSSNQQLMNVIERIVMPLGRRIDEKSPYVDARLPDGSRVHAIIPPLAIRGPTLTIRKFPKFRMTWMDLVKYGSMTQEIADFLRLCIESRLNIVVSGGTGSGKTTLLNVLSNFIPATERIITVEDSAELQLAQEHVVRLETRPKNIEGEGEVTIRDLVRQTLRMRPDRIIVGECRAGEALDMLQAMNTGHDGSLTTIHANTPRDCIARLETLVLMAGMSLPAKAIREQVAAAVHLIVQQTRMSDGSRKVTYITEVVGMQGDIVSLQDIFVYKQDGLDKRRRVQGRYVATGFIPKFVEQIEAKGLKIPRSLFTTK
ncbi:MAG: ATPase, T2SS/T4P/T4SS family [Bdellovibrionota bacterium]